MLGVVEVNAALSWSVEGSLELREECEREGANAGGTCGWGVGWGEAGAPNGEKVVDGEGDAKEKPCDVDRWKTSDGMP